MVVSKKHTFKILTIFFNNHHTLPHYMQRNTTTTTLAPPPHCCHHHSAANTTTPPSPLPPSEPLCHPYHSEIFYFIDCLFSHNFNNMGNGFSSRKWWGVNLLICKMVGFG
jgi:hypothetical protein